MRTEEPHNRRRLHAFVSGRVQGVGFRYHVLTEVQRLCPHVVGRVRNLHDGRVEVIAEGPEAELQDVLALLRRGPRWSVVEEVTDDWGDARGDLGQRFDVSHYDGASWVV
ncbi:acylphosphatase [bacterium]|nr:acylphosphatase [bacterium]